MSGWVSRLIFVSLLLCFVLSQPLSQRRTLVLLKNETLRLTHSNFFQSLAEDGQFLTFKSTSDPTVKLQSYGENNYDSLIIFGSTEELGASVPSVLSFLEEGNNLLLVTDEFVSNDIREIAEECGVEFDESNTRVIDHLNFDINDYDGYHSLIVADQLLNAPIIAENLNVPVLYRGLAMSLREDNKLVFSVLSGDSSSYSYQPGESVDKQPHTSGKRTVLVAALQARNNARVAISGSLELFSNEFFEAPVQRFSEDNSSTRYEKSGNLHFVRQVAQWTFKERGLLRVTNAAHKKVEGSRGSGYRIKDKLHFSVTVQEWDGKKWVPFKSDHLQLEFVRLDPYIRTYLKHNDNGEYYADFIVPDIYGVFTFRLKHNRLGYSFVDWQDTVAIRPFRHDEYERFIPTAYPYYASAFSMMFGVALFSIFFLYHDSRKK
jgi:oligosaccharyltransferase complex subunit beta